MAAINDLCGSPGYAEGPPSHVQKVALRRIEESYECLGRPPCDLSPSGAFHELQRQRLPYSGSPSAVAPYEKGQVALLSVGGKLVNTEAKLPPWQRDLRVGSSARMLRCESDGEAHRADPGLGHPYVDGAFRSPRIYRDFVSDLYVRGLVVFRRRCKSYLGVFC